MSELRTACRVTLISIALCVLLTTACAADTMVGKYKCSQLTSYFYGEPLKARVAQFADADLEKQFAIYICGNQFIEPPAMYLATPFAREGRKAAELLKAKLSEAKDDGTIRDIIMVFAEMQRLGTYPVTSDKDLVRVIHTSVPRIKDPSWRQFVGRKVNHMTGSPE